MKCLKPLQRFFAGVVVVTFFATNTLVPAPVAYGQGVENPAKFLSENSFRIPAEFGKVTEAVKSSGGGSLLIHIQEAHANYDAQNNIRKILQYLAKDYGVKLVLLEGAGDKLTPELLKFFPKNAELQAAVDEQLMRAGELTGAEAMLIDSSDKKVEGRGIENAGAYAKNREDYRKVHEGRKLTESFLDAFYRQWQKTADRTLNKSLREFLGREVDFEEGRLPLEVWMTALKTAAECDLKLDLDDTNEQRDWPVLIRYFRLKKISSKIDSVKVRTEQATFLADLQARKTPASLLQEITKLLEHKDAGDLPLYKTRFAFERLMDFLPKDYSFEAYPVFRLYLQQLILLSELQGASLQEEIRTLAQKIIAGLIQTAGDQKLAEILHRYRLLKKLFSLELSRKEFRELQSQNITPEKIAIALELSPSKLAPVTSLFGTAIHFYDGAMERENYMIQNALKVLGGRKDKKAVLITGGFHTDGFKEKIAASGNSYVGITPAIGEIAADSQKNYLAALLGSEAISHSHIAPEMITQPSFFQAVSPRFWRRELAVRLVRIRDIVRQTVASFHGSIAEDMAQVDVGVQGFIYSVVAGVSVQLQPARVVARSVQEERGERRSETRATQSNIAEELAREAIALFQTDPLFQEVVLGRESRLNEREKTLVRYLYLDRSPDGKRLSFKQLGELLPRYDKKTGPVTAWNVPRIRSRALAKMGYMFRALHPEEVKNRAFEAPSQDNEAKVRVETLRGDGIDPKQLLNVAKQFSYAGAFAYAVPAQLSDLHKEYSFALRLVTSRDNSEALKVIGSLQEKLGEKSGGSNGLYFFPQEALHIALGGRYPENQGRLPQAIVNDAIEGASKAASSIPEGGVSSLKELTVQLTGIKITPNGTIALDVKPEPLLAHLREQVKESMETAGWDGTRILTEKGSSQASSGGILSIGKIIPNERGTSVRLNSGDFHALGQEVRRLNEAFQRDPLTLRFQGMSYVEPESQFLSRIRLHRFIPFAGRRAEIRAKILIVDDDASVRKALERTFKLQNYEVATAESVEEALAKYREAAKTNSPFALGVFDWEIQNKNDGARLAKEVKELPIIFSSGVVFNESGLNSTEVKSALEELRRLKVDFSIVSKPVDIDELLSAAGKIVESRTKEKDLKARSLIVYKALEGSLSPRKRPLKVDRLLGELSAALADAPQAALVVAKALQEEFSAGTTSGNDLAELVHVLGERVELSLRSEVRNEEMTLNLEGYDFEEGDKITLSELLKWALAEEKKIPEKELAEFGVVKIELKNSEAVPEKHRGRRYSFNPIFFNNLDARLKKTIDIDDGKLFREVILQRKKIPAPVIIPNSNPHGKADPKTIVLTPPGTAPEKVDFSKGSGEAQEPAHSEVKESAGGKKKIIIKKRGMAVHRTSMAAPQPKEGEASVSMERQTETTVQPSKASKTWLWITVAVAGLVIGGIILAVTKPWEKQKSSTAPDVTPAQTSRPEVRGAQPSSDKEQESELSMMDAVKHDEKGRGAKANVSDDFVLRRRETGFAWVPETVKTEKKTTLASFGSPAVPSTIVGTRSAGDDLLTLHTKRSESRVASGASEEEVRGRLIRIAERAEDPGVKKKAKQFLVGSLVSNGRKGSASLARAIEFINTEAEQRRSETRQGKQIFSFTQAELRGVKGMTVFAYLRSRGIQETSLQNSQLIVRPRLLKQTYTVTIGNKNEATPPAAVDILLAQLGIRDISDVVFIEGHSLLAARSKTTSRAEVRETNEQNGEPEKYNLEVIGSREFRRNGKKQTWLRVVDQNGREGWYPPATDWFGSAPGTVDMVFNAIEIKPENVTEADGAQVQGPIFAVVKKASPPKALAKSDAKQSNKAQVESEAKESSKAPAEGDAKASSKAPAEGDVGESGGTDSAGIDGQQLVDDLRKDRRSVALIDSKMFKNVLEKDPSEALTGGEKELIETEKGRMTSLILDNQVIYLAPPLDETYDYGKYEQQLSRMAITLIGPALAKVRKEKESSEKSRQRKIFILRGMVDPGTSKLIYDTIKWNAHPEGNDDLNFDLVFQPDFSYQDARSGKPKQPVVVFGLMTEKTKEFQDRTKEVLDPIFGTFCEDPNNPSKFIPVQYMNIRSAEMAKEALLIYLGAKLAHFDDIAELSRAYGADLSAAAFGAGLDKRIRTLFTNPSLGFGGKLYVCLNWIYAQRLHKVAVELEGQPHQKFSEHKQDIDNKVKAAADQLKNGGELASILKDLPPQLHLLFVLETILRTNKQNILDFYSSIVREHERHYGHGALKGKKVALLSVGYGTESKKITASPALLLIKQLFIDQGISEFYIAEQGAKDPLEKWLEAEGDPKLGGNPRFRAVKFHYTEDIYEAAGKADITIIPTISNRQLEKIDLQKLGNALNGKTVFDGMNLFGLRADGTSDYKLEDVRRAGINLFGVGRSPLGPDLDATTDYRLNDSVVIRDVKEYEEAISERDPGQQGPVAFRQKSVAVIGGGYVGLVTAANLAALGHKVHVVDIKAKQKEIDALNSKKTGVPIYEPGLREMIIDGKAKGLITFSTDTESAVKDASIVYLAVGTPSQDTGEVDLKYILKAAEDVGDVIKKFGGSKAIVIKSTVTPNTFEEMVKVLTAKGLTLGKDYAPVSNPEFLREGQAIEDVTKPDRTVLGFYATLSPKDRARAEKEILELWYPLMVKHPHIVLLTDTASSTIVKYLANSFLAISITLSNLFAEAAEGDAADFLEVRKALVKDERVGPNAFLAPGAGYGGSCFPKDVLALFYNSKKRTGHELPLIDIATGFNDYFKKAIVTRTIGKVSAFPKAANPLEGKTVVMLGMAFKSDTDDMREASSAYILHELLINGAEQVRLHDPILSLPNVPAPEVVEAHFLDYLYKTFHEDEAFQAAYKRENPVLPGKTEPAVGELEYFKTVYFPDKFIEKGRVVFEPELKKLGQADIVFLVTEWPQYKKIKFSDFQQPGKKIWVVDGRNLFYDQRDEISGFADYMGIGTTLSPKRSEVRVSHGSWAEKETPRVAQQHLYSRQFEAGYPMHVLKKAEELYDAYRVGQISQTTLTGGLGALLPDLFEAWAAIGMNVTGIHPLWNFIKNKPIKGLDAQGQQIFFGELVKKAMELTPIEFQIKTVRKGAPATLFFRVYKTYYQEHKSTQYYLDGFTKTADGKEAPFLEEVYDDAGNREIHMAAFQEASERLIQILENDPDPANVVILDHEVFVSLPKVFLKKAKRVTLNHTVFRPGLFEAWEGYFGFLKFPEWLRSVIVHDGKISIADFTAEVYDLISGVNLVEHLPALLNNIFRAAWHRVKGFYDPTKQIRSTNGIFLPRWQSNARRLLVERYKQELGTQAPGYGLPSASNDREFFQELDKHQDLRERFKAQNEWVMAADAAELLIWLRETRGFKGESDWLGNTFKGYQGEQALGDAALTAHLKEMQALMQKASQENKPEDWATLESRFSGARDLILADPIASNIRRQVPYKGPDKYEEILAEKVLGQITAAAADAARAAGISADRSGKANRSFDPLFQLWKSYRNGSNTDKDRFQKEFESIRARLKNESAVEEVRSSICRVLIGGRTFDEEAHERFLYIQFLAELLGLEDRIATLNNYTYYEAGTIFKGAQAGVMLSDKDLEASATSMMKIMSNGGEVVGPFAGSNPEIWVIHNTRTGKDVPVLNEKGEPAFDYKTLRERLRSGEWQLLNGVYVDYDEAEKSMQEGGDWRPSARSLLEGLKTVKTLRKDPPTRRERMYQSVSHAWLVDMVVGQAMGHAFLIEAMLKESEEQEAMFSQLKFQASDYAVPVKAPDFEWQGLSGRRKHSASGMGLFGMFKSFRDLKTWQQPTSKHPYGDPATRGIEAQNGLRHHAYYGDIFRYLRTHILNHLSPGLDPFKQKIESLAAQAEKADEKERIILNLQAMDLTEMLLVRMAGDWFERYMKAETPAGANILATQLMQGVKENYQPWAGYIARYLDRHPNARSLATRDLSISSFIFKTEAGEAFQVNLNVSAPVKYEETKEFQGYKARTQALVDPEAFSVLVKGDIDAKEVRISEPKAGKVYKIHSKAELMSEIGIGIPMPLGIEVLKWTPVRLPEIMSILQRINNRDMTAMPALKQLIRQAAADEQPVSGGKAVTNPLFEQLESLADYDQKTATFVFRENLRPVLAIIALFRPDLLKTTHVPSWWSPSFFKALSKALETLKEIFGEGFFDPKGHHFYVFDTSHQGGLILARKNLTSGDIFFASMVLDADKSECGADGKVAVRIQNGLERFIEAGVRYQVTNLITGESYGERDDLLQGWTHRIRFDQGGPRIQFLLLKKQTSIVRSEVRASQTGRSEKNTEQFYGQNVDSSVRSETRQPKVLTDAELGNITDREALVAVLSNVLQMIPQGHVLRAATVNQKLFAPLQSLGFIPEQAESVTSAVMVANVKALLNDPGVAITQVTFSGQGRVFEVFWRDGAKASFELARGLSAQDSGRDVYSQNFKSFLTQGRNERNKNALGTYLDNGLIKVQEGFLINPIRFSLPDEANVRTFSENLSISGDKIISEKTFKEQEEAERLRIAEENRLAELARQVQAKQEMTMKKLEAEQRAETARKIVARKTMARRIATVGLLSFIVAAVGGLLVVGVANILRSQEEQKKADASRDKQRLEAIQKMSQETGEGWDMIADGIGKKFLTQFPGDLKEKNALLRATGEKLKKNQRITPDDVVRLLLYQEVADGLSQVPGGAALDAAIANSLLKASPELFNRVLILGQSGKMNTGKEAAALRALLYPTTVNLLNKVNRSGNKKSAWIFSNKMNRTQNKKGVANFSKDVRDETARLFSDLEASKFQERIAKTTFLRSWTEVAVKESLLSEDLNRKLSVDSLKSAVSAEMQRFLDLANTDLSLALNEILAEVEFNRSVGQAKEQSSQQGKVTDRSEVREQTQEAGLGARDSASSLIRLESLIPDPMFLKIKTAGDFFKVNSERGGTEEGVRAVTGKIMDGLIPLFAYTLNAAEFLIPAIATMPAVQKIHADAAKGVLGLAPGIGYAFILGSDLALRKGMIEMARTILKDSTFAILVKNDPALLAKAEALIKQEGLQGRVFVITDVKHARAKISKPGAALQGLISSDELVLAEELKSEVADLIVMNKSMQQRFLNAAGQLFQSLADRIAAQFSFARSA